MNLQAINALNVLDVYYKLSYCLFSKLNGFSSLYSAGWCSGKGSRFAIVRLWVQISISSRVADGGELSKRKS